MKEPEAKKKKTVNERKKLLSTICQPGSSFHPAKKLSAFSKAFWGLLDHSFLVLLLQKHPGEVVRRRDQLRESFSAGEGKKHTSN